MKSTSLDLKEEMQEVYVHRFLFQMSKKLVSIFIPLYLLELGYSPLIVITFYAIYFGVSMLSTVPNGFIVSKIGYKHTSLLASPLILLFYLNLRSLTGLESIIPAAVLGGIGLNTYWMGMNPEVARSSHEGSEDKESGLFFSMSNLASIFSPGIGALVLFFYDFQILFGITAAIMAVSFIPFLLTREHSDGMDVNFREFLRDVDYNDFIVFTLRGVTFLGRMTLWPLYLALILQNSAQIGGAGILVAAGGALSSFLVGRYANKDHEAQVVQIGALVSAISFIGMYFITGPLLAFLLSAINGISVTAHGIPIYARTMNHSGRTDLIEFFAVRELFFSSSRLSTLAIFAMLMIFKSNEFAFAFGFLLLAVSCLGTAYFGTKMTRS